MGRDRSGAGWNGAAALEDRRADCDSEGRAWWLAPLVSVPGIGWLQLSEGDRLELMVCGCHSGVHAAVFSRALPARV